MKQPSDCSNIDEIRAEIDTIDKKIIELLSLRFGYVKEIVKYKENTQDSIVAKERYDLVLKDRRDWSEQAGLNPDIIEEIYKQLIAYFIEEETKILNNKSR